LVFSFAVAIGGLLWRFIPNSNSKLASVVRNFLFAWFFVQLMRLASSVIQGTSSIPLAKILFPAGPPPSYAYALIPIAIAAALLRLAQFFNGRKET
jgi:hypothetical protein